MRFAACFVLAAASAASAQIILPGTLGRGAAPTAQAVTGTGVAAPAPVVASVGEVNFTDVKPLALKLTPDRTVDTYAVVKAPTSIPAVSFYVKLKRTDNQQPCAGSVTTLSGSTAMEKNRDVYIPLEITSCPNSDAKGVIGIAGSSGAQHERPVVLTRSESFLLRFVVCGSMGLAILVVAVSGVVARLHGHKAGDAIGEISWASGSSWASNVTAVGTAFSFLSQLTVFPARSSFGSRSDYLFLASFALALAALAPLAGRVAGFDSVTVNPGGAPSPSTHGLVAGFLLACAFTLWGAYLQLGTQIVILKELSLSGSISPSGAILARVVLEAVCAGLTVYGLRTAISRIAGNAAKSATPSATVKLAMFENAPPAMTDVVSRRVPLL